MNYKLILPFLLLLHLFILFNLQFTAWPEMLSYPYLLSNGFNLYQDIALPYQPILPILLSFFYSVFGYNLLALKIFTWSLIILCDILVFLIAKKLTGNIFLSSLTLSIYIFLQPFTEGSGLWFDLALTPFVLLGVFCFVSFKNKTGIFLLSFFLMISSLIKQQVLMVFVFLTVYFLIDFWHNKKINYIIWYFLGTLTAILPVLIYIQLNDIWPDYLFWTFIVPFYWYPKFPGYLNSPSEVDLIITLLVFFPSVLILPKLKNLDKKIIVIVLILFPLFISSFARFEFFRLQHALALNLIILAVIFKEYKNRLSLIIIPLLFALLLLIFKNIDNFGKEARFLQRQDLGLAEEIKIYSGGERIYLLDLPSTIYPMTGLIPHKPWIDNYVWYFEIDGIQDKFIAGLSKDSPKFIFRKKPALGEWDELGVYEPQKVVKYIKENYQKVDTLDSDIEVWKRKD